eukprot:COSAG03_NODE_27652_length_252_cov_0.575163_1_plen_33_part_01
MPPPPTTTHANSALACDSERTGLRSCVRSLGST